MPVLARHADGSCPSVLGGVAVRVIDCQITITTTQGLHRLATALCDHRRYPAGSVVRLCHQRWEIGTNPGPEV